MNRIRKQEDSKMMKTPWISNIYPIRVSQADLRLNIQNTKIMASSPITSWQIDGETVETVADFMFWGAKSLQMVTAALKLEDACSLEERL